MYTSPPHLSTYTRSLPSRSCSKYTESRAALQTYLWSKTKIHIFPHHWNTLSGSHAHGYIGLKLSYGQKISKIFSWSHKCFKNSSHGDIIFETIFMGKYFSSWRTPLRSISSILTCIHTYMYACIHVCTHMQLVECYFWGVWYASWEDVTKSRSSLARVTVPVYIHTYMHTYIHACIHAYIHTCMHTYADCGVLLLRCLVR
jgi:hypothetical protein